MDLLKVQSTHFHIAKIPDRNANAHVCYMTQCIDCMTRCPLVAWPTFVCAVVLPYSAWIAAKVAEPPLLVTHAQGNDFESLV